MAWDVVSGPREFDSLGGLDMEVGWAFDLQRDGDRRTISVIVAGGRSHSAELPDESATAIRPRGRSAVDAVRQREALPLIPEVVTMR